MGPAESKPCSNLCASPFAVFINQRQLCPSNWAEKHNPALGYCKVAGGGGMMTVLSLLLREQIHL